KSAEATASSTALFCYNRRLQTRCPPEPPRLLVSQPVAQAQVLSISSIVVTLLIWPLPLCRSKWLLLQKSHSRPLARNKLKPCNSLPSIKMYEIGRAHV